MIYWCYLFRGRGGTYTLAMPSTKWRDFRTPLKKIYNFKIDLSSYMSSRIDILKLRLKKR